MICIQTPILKLIRKWNNNGSTVEPSIYFIPRSYTIGYDNFTNCTVWLEEKKIHPTFIHSEKSCIKIKIEREYKSTTKQLQKCKCLDTIFNTCKNKTCKFFIKINTKTVQKIRHFINIKIVTSNRLNFFYVNFLYFKM